MLQALVEVIFAQKFDVVVRLCEIAKHLFLFSGGKLPNFRCPSLSCFKRSFVSRYSLHKRCSAPGKIANPPNRNVAACVISGERGEATAEDQSWMPCLYVFF